MINNCRSCVSSKMSKTPRIIAIALVIFVALAGIVIASQSWYSANGTRVASIDSSGNMILTGSGAFNYSPVSTQGVVAWSNSATSGGTLTVFEPMQGSSYKMAIVQSSSGFNANSGTATQTFTWPLAFSLTPGTLCNTMTGGTGGLFVVSSAGGTLTLGNSGATTTGTIIVGGN